MTGHEPAPSTLAQVILQMAKSAGARTAFGLPGVQNLAFWSASDVNLPKIITVRHEQTTVYAADGWARATGGLGLALTTTGPGAANAIAAFGEAAACGSPVLLVASEIPTRYHGTDSRVLHQSRDQAGLFRPLAKAVFTPRRIEDVEDAVAAAIATALAPPRGPTYVDVPMDLLGAERPAPGAAEVPPQHLDVPDVTTLAAALRRAGRVVIWAGGGVVADDAEAPLRALAERLHAPVVTTWAGRGLLAGHPLLVDAPVHEPEVADLIAAADLLLIVGSAFDGMATRNGAAPLPPVRAVINADPGHLGAASAPELAVVGEAAPTLATLTATLTAGLSVAVLADTGLADTGLGGTELGGTELGGTELGGTGPSGHRPWAGNAATLRKAIMTRLAAEPRTAEAAAFLASVEAALPEDAVVVCDMAVAGYWAGSYLPARRPRALQYPVGWGTLGYALPAAVGAGALGDRPVLAVCGDGGLMFGVAELATLAQERLPVTVLVVDDAGYGMLRFDQDQAGMAHRGVDLHTPDLVELAHAFGVPAVRVDGVGEPLRAALDQAFAAGAPRLVTVRAALYPPRTTSPRWHE